MLIRKRENARLNRQEGVATKNTSAGTVASSSFWLCALSAVLASSFSLMRDLRASFISESFCFWDLIPGQRLYTVGTFKRFQTL